MKKSKTAPGKKGPPFKPQKEIPLKPDKDPDPTAHNGSDPEKNDPTRIEDPEKTDPTRIEEVSPNKNKKHNKAISKKQAGKRSLSKNRK